MYQYCVYDKRINKILVIGSLWVCKKLIKKEKDNNYLIIKNIKLLEYKNKKKR